MIYASYVSAIECSSPLPLVSGRLIAGGQYFVGNTVQYMCDEGYVLIGEPIIRCTEASIWSHAPPFCKLLSLFEEFMQVQNPINLLKLIILFFFGGGSHHYSSWIRTKGQAGQVGWIFHFLYLRHPIMIFNLFILNRKLCVTS